MGNLIVCDTPPADKSRGKERLGFTENTEAAQRFTERIRGCSL
jgi:hypothetical protein